MKSAFDKKVRLRKFHEGDLVLKKMSHAIKDHRGKWAPNYEGHFVVKKVFSGGALILAGRRENAFASKLGCRQKILCLERH